MYFGYGLPRTLACSLGRDQEPWVALHHDQQFLVAVTSSTVQLWSAGLHRVRLSAVDCNTQDTGANVDALWCSSKSTLAVLTDRGHLNIYFVQLSQEPAVPLATGTNAREPCKATLHLRQSTLIESQTLPTCLAGDSKMVLVGCQDGSIQLFTWQGKVRDVLMPTYLCDDDTPEMEPGFLTHMHFCDRSRLLAVVLSNGSCAVLSAGLSSGSGFIRELEFSHWVCFMGAICVRINAVAQLIAVGAATGRALLYRLHVPGLQGAPEAAATTASLAAALSAGLGLGPGGAEVPVRQLSLEPWGHPLQQTGPVSTLEWSPDGRAIAVAYQYSGVVVWSPSGCRLFSSIRQAPDFGRSGSLTRTPAAATSADAGLFSDPKVQALAQEGMRDGDAGGPTDIAANLTLPSRSSQLAGSSLQASTDAGVSTLCWGPEGYQLTLGYTGGSWALDELQFARSLPHHHRVAHASPILSEAPVGTYGNHAAEELHVLQAHDRLLLITESAQARAGSAQPHSSSHGGSGPATDMEGMGPGGPHNRASDLTVTHLTLPYQYIASNWPVRYVAMNPNGIDIAVAGRTGLALYSRALDRWRLFGDISQERKVACVAVGWVSNIVLACTRVDEPSFHFSRSGPLSGPRSNTDPSLLPHHLLLFPKHHLDFSSLLCRFPLAQAPVAMDCIGRHVLLANEGMDLALFEVIVTGDVKPSSRATATLQLVRDVSMLEVGRPLMGITLVQFKHQLAAAVRARSGHMAYDDDTAAFSKQAADTAGNHPATSTAPPAPTLCVLHRWGGLLSALDLERGSEVLLGMDIEAFWISHILKGAAHGSNGSQPAGSAPSLLQHMQGQVSTSSLASSAASFEDIPGPREVDLPWWGYGPQGMQLWFTGSFLSSNQPAQQPLKGSFSSFQLARMPSAEARAAPPTHQDLELEFDAEVYPVGISLADAAIVGVTQRTIRGQPGKATAGAIPSFHLIPESQPVLPCLLRRLLLRGALLEARSLALRHSNGPHFSRSLEWLLFTALEADVERPTQHNGGPSLLALAASLLRSFPQLYAECVVAVARKTDISLWPALFKAVGSPGSLLDGLVERSSLTAAANMLLVVDSMQGPEVAYSKAVRLLQVTLSRAQYDLASELLRFILFPNEDELAQQESTTPQAAGTGTSNGNVGQGQATASAAAHVSAAQTKDKAGGNGSAKAKPSISWFGWLFGYGSTNSEQLQSHGSLGNATSPRRLRGASSLQADPSTTTPAGYVGTPHSASAHSALSHHAAAARRAVSEHAWGLLEQGRLLQLLQLATVTTFLPGGLMHLMRQHMMRSGGGAGHLSHAASARQLGDTPNTSLQQNLRTGASSTSLQSAGLQPHTSMAPAPVTSLDLLSALSLVVTQLPVWQSSEIEEDARAVLEVVQQLEPYAQVWVLALSILLVDLGPVRLYASQQPAEWAMVANIVKHDKTFTFLHGVIEMLGESAPELDGGEGAPVALPAHSVAPLT